MIREINKEICVGCGKCEVSCIVGCISEKENKKREIKFSACVNCGACTLVCPVGSIVVRD
ncbi:4Fe-4S binding protein [uncultured Cetobacterium sp.]|uniref:4Fe-4S binding protein n=1 Tax=uncultured Cetobacterium sp. TaxID=527638 RepID=UPI0026332E3E|nr:4Fe-4S binding protein [uncultured Cetobacterium sp.]